MIFGLLAAELQKMTHFLCTRRLSTATASGHKQSRQSQFFGIRFTPESGHRASANLFCNEGLYAARIRRLTTAHLELVWRKYLFFQVWSRAR
jgi:hypothetical protein